MTNRETHDDQNMIETVSSLIDEEGSDDEIAARIDRLLDNESGQAFWQAYYQYQAPVRGALQRRQTMPLWSKIRPTKAVAHFALGVLVTLCTIYGLSEWDKRHNHLIAQTFIHHQWTMKTPMR